jgi:hypothetical protein
VRRILEREASKQEQHWRSVHMQLNQLKEDVEADRRSSPAPDPFGFHQFLRRSA